MKALRLGTAILALALGAIGFARVAQADGIAVGEKAAALILARAAKDGANAADGYQPHTTPGKYVPTMIPAFPSWAKRTPWMLDKPSQFRPGPPPELGSEMWEKDFHEV